MDFIPQTTNSSVDNVHALLVLELDLTDQIDCIVPETECVPATDDVMVKPIKKINLKEKNNVYINETSKQET